MSTPPPPVPQSSDESPARLAEEGPSALDTLRFQDVVDDAKRLIPHLYPEWTDHNVSDPGITLVEACAARIDELSYRLGRVTGPVREAFLRLLAPPRRPAVPARALLTFTHEPGPAAPVPLVIPAGTQISTGSATREEIIFTLQEEVSLPPVQAFVHGKAADEENMPTVTGDGQSALSYSGTLTPDDTYETGEPGPATSAIILVADPGPDKLLTLHLALRTHSGRPGALQWQISTKDGWKEPESLGTSSPEPFAEPTQVTLKVPSSRLRFLPSISLGLGRDRRLFTSAEEYLALRLTADTSSAGAATWSITALHPAEAVSAPAPALQVVPFVQQKHTVAESTGQPSQRLRLAAFPVTDRDIEVTVQPKTGMLQRWTRTTSFATSGPDDPHYVVDAAACEVVFGPSIATPDGPRLCGRTPAPGAEIKARADATRGALGNVPAHSLTQFAGQQAGPQPVPDAVVTTAAADYVFVGPLVAGRPHTQTQPTVQPYTELWPALRQFPSINAGVEMGENSVLLFSGSSCLTLPTPDKTQPSADTTPAPISDLLGTTVSIAHQPFAHGIDAAMRIDATTFYLFKGALALAMTVKDGKPTPAAPQPQPISSLFRYLPLSFTRDLSAATSVHGKAGTYHLFRGAQYVEIQKTVEGVFACTSPARPSAQLWPGIEQIAPRIMVTNPAPAVGGSDPATFAELLRDTPAGLTPPQRAVTSEDYERALRDAVPGLARVICRNPARGDGDMSVLLIPELPAGTPPTAHSLTPSPGLVAAARERLEALRLLGTRLEVTSPSYHRLRITVTLTTDTPPPHALLREQVRAALVAAFHPITGGRSLTGWPLGRLPVSGDVITALARFPGTRVIGDPVVEDLDARGDGSAFLPVLDLLDLTINGVGHQDSRVLAPAGSQRPATADRSVSLALTTVSGRIWRRTDCTVENGRWDTPPPENLTHGTEPIAICSATDRGLPLSAHIVYQLAGTDESVTLDWTNPPAGTNTYTIHTTANTSLALSSQDASGVQPITVTGFRALHGSTLLPSGNNAHAQLKAALNSTLQRSLTITLHDVSHDTWTFGTPAHGADTSVDPTTVPEVSSGKDVSLVVTTAGTTGDLTGSVVCTPKSSNREQAVTLSWTATDQGEVTYRVDNDTAAVSASIGNDKITNSGLHKSASQDGGGLHAVVHISLRNSAHRAATLSLHNTLPATLSRSEIDLREGSWTTPPTDYIAKGATGTLSCTVDDPTKTMTGKATYLYTLAQGRDDSVVLGWTSTSSGTTFTVTCPKDAEIKTDNTWSATPADPQGNTRVWTLTKRTT
ncbi:baseplate J/gp47 family protein [Streptomyces sp. NPDC055709]